MGEALASARAASEAQERRSHHRVTEVITGRCAEGQCCGDCAEDPIIAYPPLFGLGGAYLEDDLAKLRDRQNQAVDAAAERAGHFIFQGDRARVVAIATISTYLRVMRESED